MLDFIKSQPSILERLMAHLETPAIVDLIFRMLHMDGISGGSGVVEARRLYLPSEGTLQSST